MTHFGKIKSYDSGKGTGMITPDKGGDALPFGRKDLQQEAQEPSVDQRYGYDTSEVDGGNKRAINLQPQQGEAESVQEEQARSQQG
ncbi:cold-shock protein [Qipengyuania sp. G39]|uniref:Cold-shock protein n=1 Tax=Qipengyuania profundimaris TaxID=3067652 RepID=A0ABT9HSA8_9SPHN|nr:cold-shock protein [Qipengyuania sp. G39]MDP4576043.1 cold-shock protein [Qipengyuania sp. G39]